MTHFLDMVQVPDRLYIKEFKTYRRQGISVRSVILLISFVCYLYIMNHYVDDLSSLH